MSLRLAVATEDFGTPLRRAIPRAGQAHVSGVQLNARREILAENMSATGLRQLWQYVRENRMEIAGLSCPTRHSLADPDYLEERVQVIRSAMDLARPLKTSQLLVPCGLIPAPASDSNSAADVPDNSDVDQLTNPFSFAKDQPPGFKKAHKADQFRALCQIASDLASYGNHVGCTLTLQLTNYDLSLIEQLLANVTTGPLQIAFDPAVAIFTGADVINTYRNLYNHVGYVRARDGLRNSDYSGIETPVGNGVVDWDEFLPTLTEADYTGWVCVERTGGDHRETDVLSGVARVKSLLPQTGDE